MAWDNDAEPLFPDLMNKTIENVPTNREKVFWRLSTKLPQKKIDYYYEEPYFQYAEIPYHPNMRAHGFFQSEKYFVRYKNEICALFEPSSEIYDYIMNKYKNLLDHQTTVAIHVRTYNREDPNHNAFPLNGREYVKKAMAFFPKDAYFIIFSDDIKWCKKNLKGLSKNMYFSREKKHYIDFYFMSLCDHNIISNSSFSWWSAYLNKNPNKIVVAPKKWFQPACNLNTMDMIPEGWIVLD